MEKEMIVRNSIRIEAPMGKVWDSLTQPEWTKQYMYNCEVVSDWKPGSAVIWRMDYEGKEFVPVTGRVLKIIPGQFLQYTVFDPNAAMEDIPANHLHVTYELSEEENEGADGEKGKTTLLNVTQEGYERAANGEQRYEEATSSGGWDSILCKIKSLLEP
jgi:uncharacterized protein YndB with AHSA1/START domain